MGKWEIKEKGFVPRKVELLDVPMFVLCAPPQLILFVQDDVLFALWTYKHPHQTHRYLYWFYW